MTETKEKTVIPIININIIQHNGKPAIELRKVITDHEAIKQIVSKAYRDQQLIIQPNFTNKALALNRLIETGLVSQENGEYYFLF